MRAVWIAAVVVVATSAAAQELQPTPRPDYSRDALLHFVARNEIKMSPLPDHLQGRIQWHIGWLEFRGLGMQWRVVYLPIAVPLAGSGLNNVARIPNPLEMTAPIAGNPNLFAERSASVNREMNRVLKLQRQARKQ
ncbi:MAG: hypothetical protein QOI58_1454 [Thermoanaerobaculia bacterium]|jgi:hypothetical protein|nr:hypothetical protein [Thermoanaerobaculia bacterium]